MGTAQVLISLIRFLLCGLVSSSFLVLLFLSFLHVWWCLLPIFSSAFPFFLSVLIFSWFGCSIPFVMCCFLLFIISMPHFSIPNFIPMFWLNILTACFRASSSFSFFEKSLISSMYIRWLIFSCDSVSFYLAMHFPSMWLSVIIAITNSNGDSSSPWKIPL